MTGKTFFFVVLGGMILLSMWPEQDAKSESPADNSGLERRIELLNGRVLSLERERDDLRNRVGALEDGLGSSGCECDPSAECSCDPVSGCDCEPAEASGEACEQPVFEIAPVRTPRFTPFGGRFRR